jgi:hypothetical protein
MSSKHNNKHKNISHKYFQGSKESRPQAPQPKGYESPKEWMQFLGYFAQSVADAALTVSSEVCNNNDVKLVGNASDTKSNRGQLTGAVDIDRYSSLENSINTLRDSNSKEHNSLRSEWRQDIRDAKQDLEKQITQNKADADKDIESSNTKINTFLASLAIIVAIVLAILGFIFKCSDDNILKKVDDNKSEIRENKRIIDENRERIIRIEEIDKKQEEANTKQQFKKNPK